MVEGVQIFLCRCTEYKLCRYRFLQYNTTLHNTTQHHTTQHHTTQHNTTQHITTQHNTAQHKHSNTAQHNTTQHNNTIICIGATYPHICTCHFYFRIISIIDNVKEPCGDSQKGARKPDLLLLLLLIQYNNHLVKRTLIETPLRDRPYSSLAASLNTKTCKIRSAHSVDPLPPHTHILIMS